MSRLVMDILTTTPEETAIIDKITARAVSEFPHHFDLNQWQLALDIECVHSLHPLDLDQFLAFGAGDFAHDLFGIYKHWDRSTLVLGGCFSPRCTLQKVAA